MAWNLADKIDPPSPETAAYHTTSPEHMYEVMMRNTTGENTGEGLGGRSKSAKSITMALGTFWNNQVNTDNKPPFNAYDFQEKWLGSFEGAIGDYRENLTGHRGPSGGGHSGQPDELNWEDQPGNRAAMNQGFITDTVQDFEDFATNIGFDMDKSDPPYILQSTPGRMFGSWWYQDIAGAGDKNIHPEKMDWSSEFTEPDFFRELATNPETKANTGAGLTYSRALEDSDQNVIDTQDDALTTLEGKEESINREQINQQKKFVEEMRTGRASGGIRGTRTGRGARRGMPGLKDIALQREKARQEYDNAIDRAVMDAERDDERALQDLDNAIMLGITSGTGLKANLERRLADFKAEDIEEEQFDAQAVLDILQRGGGNPGPWPGKCPSGQSFNAETQECEE